MIIEYIGHEYLYEIFHIFQKIKIILFKFSLIINNKVYQVFLLFIIYIVF